MTSVGTSANGSMHSGRAVRNEKHVALIDRRPAADARAVDAEAFLEGVFR